MTNTLTPAENEASRANYARQMHRTPEQQAEDQAMLKADFESLVDMATETVTKIFTRLTGEHIDFSE
jgi:hypothetical protein